MVNFLKIFSIVQKQRTLPLESSGNMNTTAYEVPMSLQLQCHHVSYSEIHKSFVVYNIAECGECYSTLVLHKQG